MCPALITCMSIYLNQAKYILEQFINKIFVKSFIYYISYPLLYRSMEFVYDLNTYCFGRQHRKDIDIYLKPFRGNNNTINLNNSYEKNVQISSNKYLLLLLLLLLLYTFLFYFRR